LEQVVTKSFHLELSHPDASVVFSEPLTADVIITDDDCECNGCIIWSCINGV
jgi:hypothetical protein